MFQRQQCPLFYAATNGHVNIVKKLLAAGADVFAKSNVRIQTSEEHVVILLKETLHSSDGCVRSWTLGCCNSLN